MTSYFTRFTSEFTSLLDRITSDTLPAGTPVDLAATLSLCDLIRSSAVTPSNAITALLKRLAHENPNVQLLTLQVMDYAVKNGGNHFLTEVGATPTTLALEHLATGGNRYDGRTNPQVQELALALIQNWAIAFKAKPTLKHSELVRSYDSSRARGVVFPPRDPLATAAMVDSLSVRSPPPFLPTPSLLLRMPY